MAAPGDVVVLCHGKSFQCADVTCRGLVDQNPTPAISSLAIFNEQKPPRRVLTVGMAAASSESAGRACCSDAGSPCECRDQFQHPQPHMASVTAWGAALLSQRVQFPRAALFFCEQKLLSCRESPGWKVCPFHSRTETEGWNETGLCAEHSDASLLWVPLSYISHLEEKHV